jgi:phage terminase large subunit GpA-like protein
MAEAWSKERLDPMIRDTPRLAGLVRPARSRDSGNTILRKTYPGGNIAIVGANAPSGLAGRPRRVVLLDEVDRFPVSAGDEGDPVALAIRRTETYHNAVVVMTSTPTIRDRSRIESEFLQSDQRRWFCPCPKCGEHQWLKWSQMKWPDGEPEKAWYECEVCKAPLTDADRLSMVRAGEWRATAPFNGKRGYHLNGINSPFRHKKGFKNRLHQMVSDYLSAKKIGKEALKTWTNTFLAETWADDAATVDEKGLMKRREEYKLLPNDCLVLTCGVDVQAMRLEATVYAWGVGEEAWAVTHRIIGGRYNTPEPWKGLDSLLSEKWYREDGTELQIVRCMVDSGKWTDHVIRQTKTRTARGVYAIKGASTAGLPVIGKETRVGDISAPHFRLGVDTAKGIIMGRLAMEDPGPGFYHFTRHPDGNQGEEFFLGLTAEESHPVKMRNGFTKQEWSLRDGRRNEPLDCAVYALSGLYHLRPNWPKLAENMKSKTPKHPNPQAQANNLQQPAVEKASTPETVPSARTYELRASGEQPAAPSEPTPEPPAKPAAPVARKLRRFGASGWVRRGW